MNETLPDGQLFFNTINYSFDRVNKSEDAVLKMSKFNYHMLIEDHL